MKSFGKFIAEAKLVHDARTSTDKPFGITFYDYSDKNSWMSPHRKSKNMQFYDHGSRPAQQIGPQHSFVHTGEFVADPVNKTIEHDHSTTYVTANRRLNQKITNYSRSAKKSTPVIDIDPPTISSSFVKSVAPHLDIDQYTHQGKPLRSYLNPEKSPNEKWAEGKEAITVYHGTSEKRARDILSTGLKPGQRPEHEHYQDLIHNYSEHNVYLSPHPNEAANYATRQAVHDNSKPVILKTTIHPHEFHKLRPDEDTMNWWKESVSPSAKQHFYNKHPEWKDHLEEHGIHFKHLTQNGGKLPWTQEYVAELKPPHVPNDEYHKTVMASLNHAFMSRPPLKATIGSSGFAHKGPIPAHKIKRHVSWEMHPTSGDPKPDEYGEAYEKMRASLKFA